MTELTRFCATHVDFNLLSALCIYTCIYGDVLAVHYLCVLIGQFCMHYSVNCVVLFFELVQPIIKFRSKELLV